MAFSHSGTMPGRAPLDAFAVQSRFIAEGK
jgi:hypothetical protein